MSAREPVQQPEGAGSLHVFVLEIDRRPTLAFQARDIGEAQEICRDADLLTDAAHGFPSKYYSEKTRL
ncbi:hypothetical protein [Bradyrhizobium sp.]|uniref:hypothetical protein n=1 Tax=Bradyrhizobium sp. TaxID=376 RepID=UPI004037A304